MAEAHRLAYRILILELEKVKAEGRTVRIRDIVEAVRDNAHTIEIAPGRTIFDWFEDQLEAGNLRKVYLDEVELA